MDGLRVAEPLLDAAVFVPVEGVTEDAGGGDHRGPRIGAAVTGAASLDHAALSLGSRSWSTRSCSGVKSA